MEKRNILKTEKRLYLVTGLLMAFTGTLLIAFLAIVSLCLMSDNPVYIDMLRVVGPWLFASIAVFIAVAIGAGLYLKAKLNN